MERKQDGASTPLSVSRSMSAMNDASSKINPFTQALLAGAVAGTAVDLSLYPIDTLKTRLQSSAGFRASGGFRGIYAGVGSAALGAAPGAAFFFVSYESSKLYLSSLTPTSSPNKSWVLPFEHMTAASIGEVAACAVRVPTEVVKQRAQAAGAGGRSVEALRAIINLRPQIGLYGVFRELYRGWTITVMREVPFTVIQFPLWEAMKSWRRQRTGKDHVSAFESGLFGSAAGAVAAGFTTPLDVLKTRMMLSREKTKLTEIFQTVMRTAGPRGFLAGIGPRIAWISAGGAVFLGSYQWAHNALA